ncbi:hypothetical protein pb186bvf_002539 [Paramecium bursaria]
MIKFFRISLNKFKNNGILKLEINWKKIKFLLFINQLNSCNQIKYIRVYNFQTCHTSSLVWLFQNTSISLQDELKNQEEQILISKFIISYISIKKIESIRQLSYKQNKKVNRQIQIGSQSLRVYQSMTKKNLHSITPSIYNQKVSFQSNTILEVSEQLLTVDNLSVLKKLMLKRNKQLMQMMLICKIKLRRQNLIKRQGKLIKLWLCQQQLNRKRKKLNMDEDQESVEALRQSEILYLQKQAQKSQFVPSLNLTITLITITSILIKPEQPIKAQTGQLQQPKIDDGLVAFEDDMAEEVQKPIVGLFYNTSDEYFTFGISFNQIKFFSINHPSPIQQKFMF